MDNSASGSTTGQNTAFGGNLAGKVRKKFNQCLLAVKNTNSDRLYTKNHLPLPSNSLLSSSRSSPSLFHCSSCPIVDKSSDISLSIENFKNLEINCETNTNMSHNPSIIRAPNPLCCYTRRYYLPLPDRLSTPGPCQRRIQQKQQTLQMLLARVQHYKTQQSSSTPSEFNDFMRRTQKLPYIDDADSVSTRSQQKFRTAPSTPLRTKRRPSLLHRLFRTVSQQIVPKIEDENSEGIGEYAIKALSRLNLSTKTIDPIVDVKVDESQCEEESEEEIHKLGIPLISQLDLDDDDDESVEDGVKATEADDPFNEHWNNFKYNGQERPIVADLGFDDTAKSFWNNDFYNSNKYNAGTPWHDLVGMFSNNAIARQQADDEEMEEKEAEDSWNPADWNSSEIGQAASFLVADDVLGELIFNEEEDDEEESDSNLFRWLFGEGYFIESLNNDEEND